MKNTKFSISTSIILISLLLSSCAESISTETIDTSIGSGVVTSHHATEESKINSHQVPAQPFVPESQQTSAPEASSKNDISDEIRQPVLNLSRITFTLEDIIPYFGQPYMTVNNNVPYFSEEDFISQSFEIYSELDDLKRCGTAYASIGTDIIPTEGRESIGHIRPSGWHTVKYNDLIDGNYLYNRCHLIGYQLSGENDNEKNLITGTRYLNIQGMQPFENKVADYVIETENHVLYRVTPVFEGDNLLASGVLMEAESIEDNGFGIQFCVYVYNVQPGIIIDYATGESSLDPDIQTTESASDTTASTPAPTTEPSVGPTSQPTPEPTAAPTPEPTTEPATEPSEASEISQGEKNVSTEYILNTNTKKFHVPSCKNVKQMKEKNKQEYTGTRDEIISMGYDPCKNCNP